MARTYSRADYNALMRSQLPAHLADMPNMRFDSAEDAGVFFARELDHIKAKTYDKVYPNFTVLNNLPRTSEAGEGAETITYYSYDKNGLAQIIANYSDDLPRADVTGKPTTIPIKSLGASYGYSVQEMRASRMAAKGLDARKADAARYQIEKLTSKIALVGDKASGMMGLLSDWNDIPLYTLPDGAKGSASWKYKEADEILLDIGGMFQFISMLTGDTEHPDKMLLAADVYQDIANRRIPDTDTTVLKFIQKNLDGIKEIVPAAELQAGQTEMNPYGRNLLVLYTDDPDKLAFEEPMPFLQHPLQTKNLSVEIPCESRVAGLMLYYPLSALIAVGV